MDIEKKNWWVFLAENIIEAKIGFKPKAEGIFLGGVEI